MTEERRHVVKYVSCEVHGRALIRSCALCRATGLTDEQWRTREAREAGEVFSAVLCTHGNPEGRCPAECSRDNRRPRQTELFAPPAEPVSSPPERVWSEYQQAIFEHVANGDGHVVVIARAGAAKTTTALQSLRCIPPSKSVLLCAFNKSIATDLQSKAPEHVEVRTLHALGYAALRKTWGPQVRPSNDRDKAILDSVVPSVLTYEDRGSTRALIKLAKAFMVESDEDLEELCCQYGLAIAWEYYRDSKGKMPPSFGEVPTFRPDGTPIDPILVQKTEDARQFRWVRAALEKACQQSAEITFEDMVYVPAKLGIRTGLFDYVFVDETQDMDRGQLALARNALRPGGRLIVIGDPKQAIYSFRGADSAAIDNIITELSATVLNLPVSYRCPVAVAEMVRRLVPDFETPPGAVDGHVEAVSVQQAQTRWAEGDFVLSRTNAPMIRLCLAALSAGTRAYIQGRDIGAGLIALVKKSHAEDIPQLCKWLAVWEESEVARFAATDKEHLIEATRDKAAALLAMTDGLGSIAELRARIEKVFSDDGGARLMFSSVHRAKGLEADRVWVLRDTFFLPKGRPEEEQNLWYVAITRTKRDLYLVGPDTARTDASSPEEEQERKAS